MSPSSRRAWVEIPGQRARPAAVRGALLAEGVGRNFCLCTTTEMVESPSSRRAWVEIAEDVEAAIKAFGCRPPRGGRG